MKTKKTITELTDDFDGSPGARTVTFALNGLRYEIELGQEKLAELELALKPYIKKARRLGGSARKASRPSLDSSLVRAWAQENGVKVSATGKVANSVIEKYLAAQ